MALGESGCRETNKTCTIVVADAIVAKGEGLPSRKKYQCHTLLSRPSLSNLHWVNHNDEHQSVLWRWLMGDGTSKTSFNVSVTSMTL